MISFIELTELGDPVIVPRLPNDDIGLGETSMIDHTLHTPKIIMMGVFGELDGRVRGADLPVFAYASESSPRP